MAKTIEQTEEVQALGLDTRDIAKEREEVQAQIDAIELPKKEDENGKQTEIALDNPADKVNALRGTFILRMVLGNTSHVSRATIRPGDYVSHREKMTGIGIRPGWKEPGGLANQLLFDCYLFDKCGWYGSELEKSLLKYQIEYIIAGKDSDLKNLEKVMSRLIRWREVANVIYLFSDSEKCAQAEALAMTLTAVLQVPALAEPVKYSILFAWAYVESLNDARCLLKGGKVPLMKTASDWKTSIASILGFSWGTEGGGDSGHGLDYQDYLKIMLFMEDSKTKNMRAMDIMEMDIRLTEGNANFRIDACFDSYLSDISISSGFGYHCNIQKRYGYD